MERLINLLKQNRRIATRCETWAANQGALLTIACEFLWLRVRSPNSSLDAVGLASP